MRTLEHYVLGAIQFSISARVWYIFLARASLALLGLSTLEKDVEKGKSLSVRKGSKSD